MSPSTSPAAGPPKIVNLWCHPRSCSTMFECMILALPNFHVLHEHFGEAWYYSRERVSSRFTEEECRQGQNWEQTYKKSCDDLVTIVDGKRTFNKDMAQYLIDLSKPNGTVAPSLSGHSTTASNPTLVPTELLFPSEPSMSHTFLIRHPSKAVPSYARLCEGDASAVTGFYGFDGKEMGYAELRKLFDFVREHTGTTPLLIESEELLKNPEQVMNMWCQEVGIEFDKSMLEWDDQKREHFDKWPGFHDDAKKSKGVGKQANNDNDSCPTLAKSHSESTKPALRPELQQVVDDCMEDYEYLKQFARKP
ncbi:uncharacterized protein JCM15063_003817 [Sporobolomyces koalae]|uniref:uncharacterized protein n=1 Tax=Sporobolomyces koalae TaxID=500713 RepID=UPI00316EF805